MEFSNFQGPKPFRFEHFWLSMTGSKEVIDTAWLQEVHGSPVYKLFMKNSNVKPALIVWNKNNIGHCPNRGRDLEHRVNALQEEALEGLMGHESEDLRVLFSDLHNHY